MDGENIVFLHIPRTGGKTFRKLTMMMRKIKFFKYLHFPADYNGFDVNTNNNIFTIIRNPKDRYRSECTRYFEIYKKGGLPKEYRERYESENIVDCESFIKSQWTHNTQTKMLSGYILYEKKEVTIDDADKVLKRIENNEIIPLTFDKFLEIIDEIKNMNPNIPETNFRVMEMKKTIKMDENINFDNCNKVDEYLYNTIVSKYNEKIENAKKFMRDLILRKIK